ncbi:MAG: substrate-binding domain-containing protein [Verrucomicrobiota bacterium JB024]|nr:substrate-binding domain-containing protein [Verrucomicrobiota bacterium JB024]
MTATPLIWHGKYVLVLVRWISPSLEYGIRSYARETDWMLLFPRLQFSVGDGIKHVDGLIMLLYEDEVVSTRKLFPDAKIVDIRGTRGLSSDAVVHPDNARIGVMAADYFYAKGFRSFMGISPRKESIMDTRLRSFARRVRELGCDVAIESGEGWFYDPKRVVEHFERYLRKRVQPLAIFTPGDFMATVVVQAVQILGYRIPEQISVLGVNNDRIFCETSKVPISSIDEDLTLVGYEAARTLDALMGGKSVKKRTLISPLKVHERHSTSREHSADSLANAILVYIRDHFSEKISIEELCRHVGASRSLANSRFRKIMGRTIGDEIERVRMEYGQSLLRKTDYKVDAVARLCGYENTSAFCRRFRRNIGLTPGAFREKEQVQ